MSEESYNFFPHAVVCSRGNIRTGLSFDAELAFDGKHYVTGTGFSTREDAKADAEQHVQQLLKLLRKEAGEFISLFGWPEAKE